jgi:hypothetical protein
MDRGMHHGHVHGRRHGHGKNMDIDFYWTCIDNGQLYIQTVLQRIIEGCRKHLRKLTKLAEMFAKVSGS